MAETTHISWADATFNPSARIRIAPQRGDMGEPVAALAERHAVAQLKAGVRVVCKGQNVVRVQVSALIISAVHACKAIPAEDVIAPSLQMSGQPQPATLYASAIDISGSIVASWRSLAGLLADQRARLWRVLFPETIAGPDHRRGAHLRSTFIGHPGAACNHG